ncbi:MAG: cupin domain-containing protein, partial [Eubacterium sp.]|nr:cupin domain-containing protein [Eubacterium sp.]
MYIIEGKIETTVDGETRILGAGDAVYVRPDTVHGLRALEETRMLDIFSPMREDFLA